MPGPSKVIVLDPDARAGRQVQLGFSREGVPSVLAAVDLPRLDVPSDGTALVIVGGTDGRALDLLRKTRLALDENKLDVPIVFNGRGVRRTDAEAAGADEVILLPAFLRDVVTIGRLLQGQPAGRRDHIVGSLAETTGVFTLVRALASLGRSAVLTLIRGLRRGEIRFFHGEVTSAQVGMIHGQAAFHQLLLWTEARFEFHHEDVVRRQQIPLSPEELFIDAERFLEGVRDSSGQLSPSMVLEQDMVRVSALGKQIPTEVHGVLRMFDGHRVLADILEDSPYRVFETLRVAQRACDVGLLRIVDGQKPKPTWRAVLAIEEWLVGSDRDAVIQRAQAASESGPIPEQRDSSQKVKGGKRKRKKRRALTPASGPIVAPTTKPDIDWGALVPRVVGAEVGSLSGVVPASQLSGEIQLPTRETQREKLEALMDTDKREKIFPKEIGLEPKVVFDAGEDLVKHEAETAVKVAKVKAEAEAREADAKQIRERDEAAAKAKAEAKAADEAAARAKIEAKKADEAAAKAKIEAKKEADAKAKAEAKAEADAKAAAAKAEADAEAKAAAETKAAEAAKAASDAAASAEAKAAADAKADAGARTMTAAPISDATAKANADARAILEAEAKARTDAAAKATAETLAKLEAEAAAKLKADALTKAAVVEAAANEAIAARLRDEAELRAEAEDALLRAEAAERAKQLAAARARASDEQAREAEELAKRLAEARAKAEAETRAKVTEEDRAEEEIWREARARAVAIDAEDAKRAAMRAVGDTVSTTPPGEKAPDLVKQLLSEGVTTSENPNATVVVHEHMTVDTTINTARVTSESLATITSAAPEQLADDPSDGIVRQLATIDTAPVRRPPPGEIPADDRPEARKGEIAPRAASPASEPITAEPSILISDLAAAHNAVNAVIAAQAAAPASKNIAAPVHEKVIAEVRKDAVHAFSDDEEEFFRAGAGNTGKVPQFTAAETFDDLDEDYRPVGFWDRLRGKKPPK